ncbi:MULTISPECIES: hypothetical protein [Sphingobium]|uniref:hypothetical protein n=1 Tax=Sphingobium sp. MI1205 TaxID=407020 RepID=UPI00076FF523|nr:hypothetical protein [Sphingobium sp. MI1205]AMK20485.1 hypothetical protein K663_20643 [Sphingobium sp. MI1205]
MTIPFDDFADDCTWDLTIGSDLQVKATERPDSLVLARFFAGYDQAFLLPDEREELNGFKTCLALNPECRRRFGRFHRELVLIIENGQSHLLGGANFLATKMTDVPEGHPEVAVALNYLFVEEAARGQGLSRRLLSAVAILANRSVGLPDEASWPAIFIEQNDPLAMSLENYAADTAHSGIDQVDRMALWARLGATLIDFPYVQPALSVQQEPDESLAYAAVSFPLWAIDAGYFRGHLESFFGISVLKGGNPAFDPAAAPQLALLAKMAEQGATVPLIAMESALERLRGMRQPPRGIPIREFARKS